MELVRIDLQMSADEAREVARILGGTMSGFRAAFDEMMAKPGPHREMMYRSLTAQQQFDSEGVKD